MWSYKELQHAFGTLILNCFVLPYFIDRQLFVYHCRFPDQVPSLLSRSVYNPILYKSMLFGLHTARMRLTSGLSSSIAFVSQLVGKLCLHGFATELWSVLLADIMVSLHLLQDCHPFAGIELQPISLTAENCYNAVIYLPNARDLFLNVVKPILTMSARMRTIPFITE